MLANTLGLAPSDSNLSFAACQCHPLGAVGHWCNQTSGQCLCREGVTGLRCNRCAPGYKQGKSPLRPCIRKSASVSTVGGGGGGVSQRLYQSKSPLAFLLQFYLLKLIKPPPLKRSTPFIKSHFNIKGAAAVQIKIRMSRLIIPRDGVHGSANIS